MSQEKKKHPDTRDFEKALNKRDQRRYVLHLFVAGITPRSLQAVERVRQLCEEHLPGRYELEVVDIYQHPDKARREQIIAAPTLVKDLPLPLRKFVGDLTDRERVLVGLDIKIKSEGKPGTGSDDRK